MRKQFDSINCEISDLRSKITNVRNDWLIGIGRFSGKREREREVEFNLR